MLVNARVHLVVERFCCGDQCPAGSDHFRLAEAVTALAGARAAKDQGGVHVQTLQGKYPVAQSLSDAHRRFLAAACLTAVKVIFRLFDSFFWKEDERPYSPLLLIRVGSERK